MPKHKNFIIMEIEIPLYKRKKYTSKSIIENIYHVTEIASLLWNEFIVSIESVMLVS